MSLPANSNNIGNVDIVRTMGHFIERIERMNKVMQVSCPDKLTDLSGKRLHQFKHIIMDEIHEIDAVIGKCYNSNTEAGLPLVEDDFVDLADWLADIIVYVTSEARRWGIPIVPVLHAVMDCQDSKLVDGKPVKDENDKFVKGPNYKPPEEDIRKILFPPPAPPEEDDGVVYGEEDNEEQVAFMADTVVGLVIPFPKSHTGFAKIVGYSPEGHKRTDTHSKKWNYKLVSYSPAHNRQSYDGNDFIAGQELDELIDKVLKEKKEQTDNAAKTQAK